MSDGDYGGMCRSFQLYDEHELPDVLEAYGCRLVEPAAPGDLGGLMYLTDAKPMEYCLFHVEKS